MQKNIYDIMTEDAQPINDFFSTLSEMAKTRYILAENRISNLLKSVAYSKTLYQFFGKILKDFDYESEVNECRVSADKLTLPLDKKKMVAMVFCLLNDIDSKNVYLNDFLRQFYKGDKDINVAYYEFYNQVIQPFAQNCQELLESGVDNYVYKESSEDFSLLIADIATDIEYDPALTVKQREEFVFSLDKLGNLIRKGEKKGAIATFESLYANLIETRISSEGNFALKKLQRIVFSMND